MELHSFYGALVVIFAILVGFAVAPFFSFAAGQQAAI